MTTRWGIAGTGSHGRGLRAPTSSTCRTPRSWPSGRARAERAREPSRATHGIEGCTLRRPGHGRRRRRLHRHPAPAAPRAGPGRASRPACPVAGREGLHRHRSPTPARSSTSARDRGVFCMEAMWTRFQPAVVEARRLVDDGEIGDVIAVQADLGAYRTYDPASRLFDPGARRRRDPRPRGLRHLLRPALPRHPRPRGRVRDALPQRRRRRRRRCTCRTTTGAAPRWPARSPPRPRVARSIWGTGGSIELAAALPPPDLGSSSAATARTRRPATCPRRGRGYSHEIDEVNRCLAAGLTESPVVPLDDTVGVQWVMEETLSQLGITTAEGSVDLLVADPAAQRLGVTALLLGLQPPLLRAAGRAGRPARWRGWREGLAQQRRRAARGRRPGCGAASGAPRRRWPPRRPASAAAPGARCASVSVDAVRTSYSSSTRLSRVLTDWPPGPGEREKRSTRSASGTTRPVGQAGTGRDVQVLHAPRLRHSIAGQVSITIGTPAAVVRSNAASSITPSWNHTPFAPDGDRLVGELAGRLGAPEHVDHVDRERHVGQRGVALLAEHGRGGGVDRHDPLAAPLEQAARWSTRCGRVARTGRRPPRSRGRRACGRRTRGPASPSSWRHGSAHSVVPSWLRALATTASIAVLSV